MLFSVIICRIWSFATAINKLLFDKDCHICNSYQKGAIFYQSHKVFYTTHRSDFPIDMTELCNYFRRLLSFPLCAQKARKSTKIVFEIYRERFYDLGIYVFKESFKDNSVS